jgi:hypothetical protein
MSCNFVTHVTYPLALTTYKYNKFVSVICSSKMSYKANCKTPFFLIVIMFACSIVIINFEKKNQSHQTHRD